MGQGELVLSNPLASHLLRLPASAPPPVRAHPLRAAARAALAAPPCHPCDPIPALPRRVRFSFFLDSYAKRTFFRLTSCVSLLPRRRPCVPISALPAVCVLPFICVLMRSGRFPSPRLRLPFCVLNWLSPVVLRSCLLWLNFHLPSCVSPLASCVSPLASPLLCFCAFCG